MLVYVLPLLFLLSTIAHSQPYCDENACVALAGGSACCQTYPCGPAPDSAPYLTIASIFNLGLGNRRAIEMAVSDVNRRGLLPGRTARVRWQDSKDSAEGVVPAFVCTSVAQGCGPLRPAVPIVIGQRFIGTFATQV